MYAIFFGKFEGGLVSIPQAVSTIAIAQDEPAVVPSDNRVSIPQAVSTIAIRPYGRLR